MNDKVMAALLAVSMLTVATSAEARRHYTTQSESITCNRHGCSDFYKYTDPSTASFATRETRVRKIRVTRHKPVATQRQTMLINKPQEYVKPEHPGDKLVTREAHEAASGSGLVVSHKTGARAHGLDPKHAHLFQAVINALEDAGASIYYMGGWRPGRCSIGSQHPCHWALDICQDSRGHVSGLKDCHLPLPVDFHRIVRAAGLYEGSVWCNTDYGHVQVKPSGGNCGPRGYVGDGKRHYYASMTGKVQVASIEPETRTSSAKRHRVAHRHRNRHQAAVGQPAYQNYADSRSYGGYKAYAAIDDGSRRGRHKTMKQRRASLAMQRYAAYAF